MKPRRRIEREFGVPIAGEIIDRQLWTKTALKKLPETGQLDWPGLFGRQAPVVLDLGCGNGRYSIASAVWRPGYNHLGIDVLPVVIRYATRRANQRGLWNIRFAVIDARQLLQRYIPPHSVAEIHCYHPQPYYDPSKVRRRLVTPEFMTLVHRALVPGGLFYLQTDNPGYWIYMKEIVPVFLEFEERKVPWPDAPKGRTRREIIAMKRGLPVFRGLGRARSDLDEAEAIRLAERLPEPVFDADRRLMEIDRIEKDD